jgi:hypothetical protein
MYIQKAVGSKSIFLGGGRLKNKFELLLHISSSFVCVWLYKWNMRLLTTLIHDLIPEPTTQCAVPGVSPGRWY